MSQIWDIYCKHCLWSIFGPCWCTKSCKTTFYAHLSRIWKLARFARFIRKVFAAKILPSGKFSLFLTLIGPPVILHTDNGREFCNQVFLSSVFFCHNIIVELILMIKCTLYRCCTSTRHSMEWRWSMVVRATARARALLSAATSI